MTMFCLHQMYFDEHIEEERYCGYLYGLGTSYNGNGYNQLVAEES